MPLTINVGLSRKASQNYQSTGVSVNVTAELDSALLGKPEELQQQVASLYAQAQTALDRQANQGGPPSSPSSPPAQRPAAANGSARSPNRATSSPRNGTAGSTTGATVAGMTASQRRAIDAIAHRMNADTAQEAQYLFGVKLDDLTIRQASGLIDHLKALTPAANRGNGSARG